MRRRRLTRESTRTSLSVSAPELTKSKPAPPLATLSRSSTIKSADKSGGVSELGEVGGWVEVGTLNYTDHWPTVEVTVAINEILQLDLTDLSYEADFSIFLDWIDPTLRRGEHYEFNADKGRFELANAYEDPRLACAMDSVHFFNPQVQIQNSKQQPEAEKEVPYIFDEVFIDGQDVPWLTKRYNFLGRLTCRQVQAVTFPFDVQGLQIRILVQDLDGVTSLGDPRRVSLREPSLRKDFRQRQRGKHPMVEGWARVKQEGEIMSHMWRLNDDDGEAFGFGEMRLMAMGGGAEDVSAYTFHVVLRRQWYPRYMIDFLIQNLQVLAATFGSLYIPFTPDMLVNRMTIALTVLLTLVSSLSTRPALIEYVPYSTLYDYYGQIMVFSVCLICFSNWVVHVSCWGMYRAPGIDDFFDYDKHMVVSNLRRGLFSDPSWCEQGQCGASTIDCQLVYLQMVAMVGFSLCVLLVAQKARITVLLKIKHQVDAADREPGKYSRLVLCENGFELINRTDVQLCAAHAAMLPCVTLFLKVWRASRRLKALLLCGCSYQQPSAQQVAFHAMEAEELLDRASEDMRKRSKEKEEVAQEYHRANHEMRKRSMAKEGATAILPSASKTLGDLSDTSDGVLSI